MTDQKKMVVIQRKGGRRYVDKQGNEVAAPEKEKPENASKKRSTDSKA